MRRLGTVLCVVTTVCLTWCAHASPLSSGTEAVPFRLKRGFHPTPSTRVLPLVYLGDDVGAHYWRAEQEVQAERRAFLNDPVNKGAAFRPHTYMD